MITPFDHDPASGRPLWLTTLADLGLLLVGFFVFIHASRDLDPAALSAGIREGFGVRAAPAAHNPPPERPTPPMAQELAGLGGFAPGSAAITTDTAAVIRWAASAARDPRTRIRIAGGTDGSAADVDRATGSAGLLAADRARAVAVALVRSGAIAPERIVIAGGEESPKGRRVLLTVGFAGIPHSTAASPARPN